MTTPGTSGGMAWVARETRRRCADLNIASRHGNAGTITERQIQEAAALAVDLYDTASAYGIDRGTADAVTSFISAAIDGILARDCSR